MVELNSGWKRNFDVYDRIGRLGIDLGKKEDTLPPPGAQNLAQATFTPSGLVFLSGTTAGMGAVTDDDAEIEKGGRGRSRGGYRTHPRSALGTPPSGVAERRLVLRQGFRHGQLGRRRGPDPLAPGRQRILQGLP